MPEPPTAPPVPTSFPPPALLWGPSWSSSAGVEGPSSVPCAAYISPCSVMENFACQGFLVRKSSHTVSWSARPEGVRGLELGASGLVARTILQKAMRLGKSVRPALGRVVSEVLSTREATGRSTEEKYKVGILWPGGPPQPPGKEHSTPCSTSIMPAGRHAAGGHHRTPGLCG